MSRLILSLSFFIVFFGRAESQPDKTSDSLKEDAAAADNNLLRIVTDSSNLKIENKLSYYVGSAARPLFDGEYDSDLSEYMADLNGERKYLASFGIVELLWPRRQVGGRYGGNDLIMIGVKKPSYRLSKNPYIRGNLDFSLGGSLLGLENKGLITVSYQLKTADDLRRLSSSISFERFSFSINIPFGKSR